MRPTAQQCLGHSWFKENGAADEEVAAEDPVATVPSGLPPLTARTRHSEHVVEALGDYMGRSKFEKAVLLQVASHLHTSQMSRVAEVFAVADRDRNGTVSRDELVWVLINLGVEKEDAQSYASCVDVDGNGLIEYTELVSGCIGLLYESLRSLLWQSFCVLDIDGNGVLSRDEVLAVVTRAELAQHGFPGNEPISTVNEALDRMDVDHNGLISFDELCRHFLPRPSVPGNQVAADGPPAMQDEEFALLLDEIEAGHRDNVLNTSTGDDAPCLERSMSPLLREALAVADDRGVLPDGALCGHGAVIGIGGVADLDLTSELLAAGFHSGQDPVRIERPAPSGAGGLGCEAVDSAHGDGRMTVDEELSHLLADIANGC